jgi:hypothetical protein
MKYWKKNPAFYIGMEVGSLSLGKIIPIIFNGVNS